LIDICEIKLHNYCVRDQFLASIYAEVAKIDITSY